MQKRDGGCALLICFFISLVLSGCLKNDDDPQIYSAPSGPRIEPANNEPPSDQSIKTPEEDFALEMFRAQSEQDLEQIARKFIFGVWDWAKVKLDNRPLGMVLIGTTEKDIEGEFTEELSAADLKLLNQKIDLMLSMKAPLLQFFDESYNALEQAFLIRNLELFKKFDLVFPQQLVRSKCVLNRRKKCIRYQNTVQVIFDQSEVSKDFRFSYFDGGAKQSSLSFIKYLFDRLPNIRPLCKDDTVIGCHHSMEKVALFPLATRLYFFMHPSFNFTSNRFQDYKNELFRLLNQSIDRLASKKQGNIEFERYGYNGFKVFFEFLLNEYSYAAFENKFFDIDLRKEGLILKTLIEKFPIGFSNSIERNGRKESASTALSRLYYRLHLGAIENGDLEFLDFMESLCYLRQCCLSTSTYDFGYLLRYFEKKFSKILTKQTYRENLQILKLQLRKYLSREHFFLQSRALKRSYSGRHLLEHYEFEYSKFKASDEDDEIEESFKKDFFQDLLSELKRLSRGYLSDH
jgi:hypothetical protein